MSEPSSLFARIHITKDNFDKFLTTKPKTPKLDNDWLEWWDSKEMYNKTALQEKNLSCYNDPTNEAIINGWVGAKNSLSFSDYSAEHDTWHFGIIMFTDNYYEMLPALAFIKHVAEFKQENREDFAIIYDYFWGSGDVCAYINYETGKALFDNKMQNQSDINSDILKYTEDYLGKKFDDFSAAKEWD